MLCTAASVLEFFGNQAYLDQGYVFVAGLLAWHHTSLSTSYTSSQLTFTLTDFHGRGIFFSPLTNHQRLTYQINESKQILSRHWCAAMTHSGYGGVLGVVQWSKSRLLSWAILRTKWTAYYILVEIQIKGYIVDLSSSCVAPVIQLYEQLVSRNLTHLFLGPPTTR